jgi:hypothetical protein
MVKIEIVQNFEGALDGVNVQRFSVGMVLTVEQAWADNVISGGLAKKFIEFTEFASVVPENKMDNEPENKDEYRHVEKKGKKK